MSTNIPQLIAAAGQAMAQKNWLLVQNLADLILRADPQNADGHYLTGTVHRAQRRSSDAIDAFKKGLELDPRRYDIAIQLANSYSITRRNSDAAEILGEYEDHLYDNPHFLDLAGTIYTEIGLSEKAWPLFKRANELQPNIDVFQANLATCAVFLGKVEEARKLYVTLLERFPEHRKNHYQFSRLKKATDLVHVDQMKAILSSSKEKIDRDVPLYFAIAKELEDLELWDECFEYYRKACDAVLSIAKFDAKRDTEIIDTIIDVFNRNWFETKTPAAKPNSAKTPIFIVGLPRTGTTLVERIVSSHSEVSSLGETLFLQMAMHKMSSLENRPEIDSEMLRELADKDLRPLADNYMQSIAYRLGEEEMFIEKLPFNFLYLGLIAKAWPNARFIHMVRNPIDACFSMYKQVFTWAYRYSYSIEHLGQYYVAYNKLRLHWNEVLGDRVIEVGYENLVHDQEAQTRKLLDRLGLEFEEGCLHFEKNTAPSATASSVQVRSKVHSGSIGKWHRFEKQLAPLKEHLIANGIDVSSS
jgi:tetratricopeptide (TPR) repeat protein